MEFTGRIIKALEPRTGVSSRTGNPWKMQDFVIEETMAQVPKRMVFNVFGEDNLNRFNIQEGQELTVSFDINAREYNGRWYNDVRAYNVTRGAASVAGAPQATPFPPQAAPQDAAAPFPPAQEPAGEGSADDLPF